MSTTSTASSHHLNRSFGQSSRASSSTQPYEQAAAGTQKFVIGKIDAGIAVLISDSVHLIEFPSLLLPSGVGPGSIVNIACTRNFGAERSAAKEFWDLQREIKESFGEKEPRAPNLRIRNTTQTSVTLEWDKLDLASASLISLSIYRNNQRLTTIPSPLTNTSTKLSGLQLDTDYTFHLVLKTSAGTYSSPIVKTRTHTIDNTSGISVCFGFVEPRELLDQAKEAIREMGCKWDEKIQIDTTHFVATSSSGGPNGSRSGPGVEYQKAVQLSIPVVSPEWLLSCHRSSKMVPISAFYLGTTNHAASLSSAQLVSSPQTPSSRQITSNSTSVSTNSANTTPKTVPEEEEPKPEEETTPVPASAVQLEEDVEEPPEDQRQLEQDPVPAIEVSPAPHADATKDSSEETENSSTKGVKSEIEENVGEVDHSATTEHEEEEAEDAIHRTDDEKLAAGESEEPEKPSSGVPQVAVVVSDESESAHEVDPQVEEKLEDAESVDQEDSNDKGDDTVEAEAQPTEQTLEAGQETPLSEAQESVDLDDAFEDTEDDVVEPQDPKESNEVKEGEVDEAEGDGNGDGEKSLVDIEL